MEEGRAGEVRNGTSDPPTCVDLEGGLQLDQPAFVVLFLHTLIHLGSKPLTNIHVRAGMLQGDARVTTG